MPKYPIVNIEKPDYDVNAIYINLYYGKRSVHNKFFSVRNESDLIKIQGAIDSYFLHKEGE